MILIADSGATKTHWKEILPSGLIKEHITRGLNPNHLNTSEIHNIINNKLKLSSHPNTIYFYGAGCGTETQKTTIYNVLISIFKKSTIYVYTDILGAARSLCNNNKGIIGIIGTGSNACFYNGLKVIKSIPSLGYILGDEGSGVWMGKQLVKDFFRKNMEEETYHYLSQSPSFDYQSIMNKAYQQSENILFLSSFSKLIAQNIHVPYFNRLVYTGFEKYFKIVKSMLDTKPPIEMYCTGSVAFIYSKILKTAGKNEGIKINRITKDAISGLTMYHQKNNLI